MKASRGRTVLVVGAGPAGLATAVAARREGFSVTVLDASTPPCDKACGEGLMPDAVASLRQLGVTFPADGFAHFGGIRYLAGDRVAAARFPSGHGLGVRRTLLHQALLERSEAVGVDLRWQTRVTGLTEDGVTTASGQLCADWIVAADGLRSKLRRWAGLEGPRAHHQRFGVRRHFAVVPWTDLVEVYWGPGFEAYVTPVGSKEVGVAFLWEGRKASFDELLADLPALGARLEGAVATSRDRGCGPLHQRVRAVTRGRLALVGDASGYLDAITGEGLALAFHQAIALAGSMKAGSLSGYAKEHRRISRLPNAVTRFLLFAERHPALLRRLIRTLEQDPRLFRSFLGIHARTHRLRDLGLTGAWRLVRGLAAT